MLTYIRGSGGPTRVWAHCQGPHGFSASKGAWRRGFSNCPLGPAPRSSTTSRSFPGATVPPDSHWTSRPPNEVMAHQTISVNLETRLRARLGQRLDKILPVHLRRKGFPLALARPARGEYRSPLAMTIRAHHPCPADLSRRLVPPTCPADLSRRSVAKAEALRRRKPWRRRMVHGPRILNSQLARQGA
jgi:hypothetical protein